MVVAVRKGDSFVVGVTSSDGFVDMTEKDLTLEENLPACKVSGVKNCYLLAEDLSFEFDLLKFNGNIFKNVTDGKSVSNTVVPKIKSLLSSYDMIKGNGNWNGQILIIKDDKAFVVSSCFVVNDVEEFAALGYEKYVIGALESSRDKTAEERVLYAFRHVEKCLNKKLFPVTIIDYNTNKRKVVKS